MLGIDVSKDTLACTLVDRNTREVQWRQTVPNSSVGWESLLAKTPAEVPWVLEPTGRYSVPGVEAARQADRKVLLASPRKAKSFLASLQTRAKTDRIDSRGLALMALSQPLPDYPLKSPEVEILGQLMSARALLTSQVAQLQQQQEQLAHIAAVLSEAITALKQQIRALDQQIKEQARQTASVAATIKTLKEVPGIGPLTATAVAVCLTSKSFAHPDQFIAYIGLDIGVCQSGQRHGQRGLTKQGHADLRRLLYLCAQANLLCKSSPFKNQFARECAKGLPKTAALCAVARKLAKVCWSLHKHQTSYDAARVGSAFKPSSA